MIQNPPRNSSGIPLPVSDMIILQNEYPSISIRFILKITFPFGDVYLNALDNKLRIAELIFPRLSIAKVAHSAIQP